MWPPKESKRDLVLTAAERRALRRRNWEGWSAKGPKAAILDGGRGAKPVPDRIHLRYKAKGFPVEGFGQTVMISNQDIVFAPSDGLEPGMNAEIVVAWPPLLDDRNLLELVLHVTITGTKDDEAEARILSHHFRSAERGR